MCIDPYQLKTILAFFPKEVYQVIPKNGHLMATDPKALMPEKLKYTPITPTKVCFS